jgi:hypothetical protein
LLFILIKLFKFLLLFQYEISRTKKKVYQNCWVSRRLSLEPLEFCAIKGHTFSSKAIKFVVIAELHTIMKFDLKICVLILLVHYVHASGKESLKSDTSFGEVNGGNVMRGRKAEERVNLSFPGTKW